MAIYKMRYFVMFFHFLNEEKKFKKKTRYVVRFWNNLVVICFSFHLKII